MRSSSADSVALARRDVCRTWRTTIANLILLSLLVLGIAIWRFGVPLVERAWESLGEAIAALAAYAGEMANGAVDEAYAAVAADPVVQQRLGAPITFARLEEVEWLPSQASEELAFVIAAHGSRASGKVYCRVRITAEGPQVKSLDLATEDEVRHLL